MNKNLFIKHDKLRIRYLILSLLAFVLNIGIYAQEINVSGVVSGEDDGLPIINATVVVNGTNKGTVTNIDGMYTIRAKVGDVLKISYVGMMVKTVTVTQARMDVKLKANSIVLEEVVAIGYGTVKKKELTGAVAQVKGEDIANTITSDLGNALQGQISGVNIISSSGAPGDASEILIRGISSITGSNTPLFVVDGVPYEDDPRISPNEIQTIDVLKDAASCAIYGTRGAAGVILITTKQGKEGKLKIAVDGNYGIQQITSGTPLMNAREQSYFDIIAERNKSNTPDNSVILPIARYTKGFQNDTELSKVIFNDNAPTQNYNVNLSGGNKQIAYNIVGGYFKTDGVVVNSGFERFNTRINATYKSNNLQIGANVGMSNEDIKRSQGYIIIQAIKYYPTQDPIDLSGNAPLVTFAGDALNRLNWVEESLKTKSVANRTSTFVNFNANYKISKTLSVSTRLGTNLMNEYGRASHAYQEIKDINGLLVSNPSNSYVQMNAARRTSLVWDAGLNYQKTFNKQKLSLFLGSSTERYTFDSFVAKRTGLLSQTLEVLNAATLDQIAYSGNLYDNTLLGFIGRVQYDYKSKYLFSATMRRDGSSRLSKENQIGYFPSVSGAWNLSDEKFWKPLDEIINNFKLRASYGTTGNTNIPPYSYSATIASGIDNLYGSSSSEVTGYGSIQTGYANAVVKWETSIQSNFGVDLAMFRNKLTFSAEYYNTYKKDMLFPVSLPGSAGGGGGANVILNVGNMTNKGVELTAGYKTNIGKSKWELNGTFSTNTNKITKINGLGGFIYTNDNGLINGATSSSQVTVLAEGYEAGAFFLYPTNGIADTQEKLANYQQLDPTARMGDLIYVDTDKDGEISDADRVYSGSGLPKFEIGFNMRVEYRNFDFAAQLYSAIGHEIMNGAKATAFTYGRHKDLIYAWSNSNPVTSIPAYRGDLKSQNNYKGYTSLWLEDGSYLRFKTITLGYNVNNEKVRALGVNKLRVFLTAQNPITITNYSGYDPEIGGGVSSRGLDKGNYPITSLYSAGININF